MGLGISEQQLLSLINDSRGTLRELDRVESADSLSSFIKRAWSQIEPSTVYKHNWHIDAISAHLEAVSRGELRRVIINVPPGSSKSLSCSVFFPAWEWGPRNMPGTRYIGTSYSERFAIRDNARTKNLITSEWYQDRWGDHVTLVKFGEKKIENTAYGFREAIPFTSLTGGRADRLIIDDPHSTETAESDADREKVTRVFLESVPTRLNDPERSAIIIIMQRLHEEDVTGVALSKELGYEHVMIPMEYDSSRHFVSKWFEDPRTEDGDLMFPARFPASVVQEYKDSLGPYGASGQLQQAPVPRGGGIFRWDWWQLWGNPDDSEDPLFKAFPQMEFVIASLDSAYTEKEENDFSALTIWGVFRQSPGLVTQPKHYLSQQLKIEDQTRQAQQQFGGPKAMLMNAWQKRLPLHGPDPGPRESWETAAQYLKRCQKVWGLVEWTAYTCNRFKVDRLLIEGKASGISVAQEIRRLHSGQGWSVQLIDPGRSDKLARAHSVQHLFADEMIYAPDRDWADMVKSQMATFPKAAHDDLTDSATQALKFLRDKGLLRHESEIERDMRANSVYKSSVTDPLYPV